jgi:DNA repair exonuclease SbcCD ATPase subunit
MIRFKRLRAQNAGSFKELSIPLDKQGNVLIVGENRDEPRTADGRRHSNGSGKTTIPELLTNGLFDVGSKPGFSKNGILNLYHPKDCFVEVEFETTGHSYVVRRYRKHSNHGTSVRLFQDGVDISCQGTRAIPDTQKLLESKLGLTLGEWFGFVYLAQNHTHAMVTGKPSEKREYLSRVFSLDVIDNHDKTLKVYLEGLSDKTSELRALEERRRQLKSERKRFSDSSYPDDLDEQVKTARKSVQEAETSVANARLSAKRSSILGKLTSAGINPTGTGFTVFLETERKSLKAKLLKGEEARRLAKRRNELKNNLKVDLPDESAVRHKLDSYGDRLAALGDAARLQVKLAVVESKLRKSTYVPDVSNSVKRKIEKLQNKRKEIEDRLIVLNSDLSRLRTLDGHSACPTCLQSLKVEHITSLISSRTTEKDEVSVTSDELDQKISEYSSKLADLEAYSRLVSEREDIAKDLSKIGAPPDVASVLRKIKTKQDALQESLADLKVQARLKTELSSLSKPDYVPSSSELEEMQSRLDLLTEALVYDWDVPHVDLKHAKTARKKAQKLLDKLTALRAERDAHTKNRDRTERALAEVKRDIEKLSNVATGHHVATTMRLALKDLKSLRLHEATRVLTSILPGYVSAMFPGKNVTVKIDDRRADAFDLLFEKGGKIVPLTSLSGGQGKKVAIATILAFTQLTSKRVNLLIADEPYSALDRPSRQICDELIRDAGVSSTFLMTHDLDLLARRYDQVWRCIMKNNVTTLRRSPNP